VQGGRHLRLWQQKKKEAWQGVQTATTRIKPRHRAHGDDYHASIRATPIQAAGLQHQPTCHRAAIHSGPDKASEDAAKARRTVKRRVRFFHKCEKLSGPAPQSALLTTAAPGRNACRMVGTEGWPFFGRTKGLFFKRTAPRQNQPATEVKSCRRSCGQKKKEAIRRAKKRASLTVWLYVNYHSCINANLVWMDLCF
jgi:hypothetical protein